MLTELKVGSVVVPLVTATIKRGKENKGKSYLMPNFEKLTLAQVVEAWGLEKIYESIVQPKVTQYFQNLYFDALDEATGKLNEEEFAQQASALSARGETIAVLMDRLFTLITKFAETKPEDLPALGAKIQALKVAIETKKRKTQEDQEAEAEGVPTA